MKAIFTFLNTRLRVLFFFVWMYALIELLQNQRYQTFLRPEFGWVLAAALLMFLAMTLAEISRPAEDRLHWYEFQRPLILLVPLLFLLNAQGASLDYYTFSKRFTGTAAMSVNVEPSIPTAERTAEQPSTTGPGTRRGGVSSSLNPSPNDRVVFNRRHGAETAQDADTAQTGPASGVVPGENTPAPMPGDAGDDATAKTDAADDDATPGTRTVTLVELYEAPGLYEGKTVTVVGMTDVNEDVSRQFGQRARVVYRFLVSCCAADAQPIAMVFEPGQAVNIQAQGVWVSVTGRFTLEKKDGRTIPVLRDATMSTVTKPRDEYLY